jgi:tRNA dimethylallyltransferase
VKSAAARTLRLLTGCTASGKTERAIEWATALGAEIVSADALLFYRGMNIGTAKPSLEQRDRVPHHLIDIREVRKPMNVAEYAELARRAAEEIAARGKPVLVVGGSGFYLKTFLAPVADSVAVDPEVRARVAELQVAGGLPALLSDLERLNPGGLGPLDRANPRRVARALERCQASGLPLRELAERFARQPPPFADWRVEVTRIERDPVELGRRIEARARAMVGAGLIDEVRTLRAAGLDENPSASRAIGYRESIAVLDGRLAPSELAAEITKNTRALVKKQRTWFRTQLPPHQVQRLPASSG